MNITPMNYTNTSFGGKILTTGLGWNKRMTEAFKKSPMINELAKGEHDIIGHIHSKKAGHRDMNHYKGEKVYRLDLKLGNSASSIVNIIKSYLDLLPKTKFNKFFHREASFIDKLNNSINITKYKSDLGINE